MFKMNYLLILPLVLFLNFSYGQEKSIKFKKYDVVFTYKKDSILLKKKELKKIIKTSLVFFDAIEKDDYNLFVSTLSDTTISVIPKEKLERKYKKYKAYQLNMTGELTIRSLQLFQNKDHRESGVLYSIVFSLPPNTTIARRVGFDPIKHATFKNHHNFVGIVLIKNHKEYDVVIPW